MIRQAFELRLAVDVVVVVVDDVCSYGGVGKVQQHIREVGCCVRGLGWHIERYSVLSAEAAL